jgi:hypothetical protein
MPIYAATPRRAEPNTFMCPTTFSVSPFSGSIYSFRSTPALLPGALSFAVYAKGGIRVSHVKSKQFLAHPLFHPQASATPRQTCGLHKGWGTRAGAPFRHKLMFHVNRHENP